MNTPGPWQAGREDIQFYDGGSGEPFWSVYRKDEDERCEMHLGSRVPLLIAKLPGEVIDEAEGRANARVIAGAPEMLDRLKMLLGIADDSGGEAWRCTDPDWNLEATIEFTITVGELRSIAEIVGRITGEDQRCNHCAVKQAKAKAATKRKG